jgi:hypothetical protein
MLSPVFLVGVRSSARSVCRWATPATICLSKFQQADRRMPVRRVNLSVLQSFACVRGASPSMGTRYTVPKALFERKERSSDEQLQRAAS